MHTREERPPTARGEVFSQEHRVASKFLLQHILASKKELKYSYKEGTQTMTKTMTQTIIVCFTYFMYISGYDHR